MKRIGALIGAGLLALLYILTLVFALMKNPQAVGLFKASLAATIIIPCLIYAYQLIYRVLKRRGEELADEAKTAAGKTEHPDNTQ
ncbi:MAG TPA: hypothetical protein PLU43_10960 [Lachnospiraceae bacterium]|nr:hypothetical protein [Lachnospiraceae bacterium]